MKIIPLKLILLIILSVLTVNTAYSLSHNNSNQSKLSSSQVNNIKDTIIALDITRDKYNKELYLLDPIRNKILFNEYTIFIDYLAIKIKNYCLDIITLIDSDSLDALPCRFENKKIVDINSYQTSEERVEDLDDELMLALGNFDEMLLVEDEKIAQISKHKIKSESSTTSSINSSMKQKDNKQRKQSRENGASANNKQKKKNYKRNKLNKIDDDIVARQLKEAAEAETDPDLKEKLWIEYYNYKKSVIENKENE